MKRSLPLLGPIASLCLLISATAWGQPADLNAWMGEEARKVAGTLWQRLPGDVTGSPYGNYEGFLASAADFGRNVAPEIRASIGMHEAGDWERTREGALAMLSLRMEGLLNRYIARVTTVNQVMSRVEPLRNDIWNSLPEEAKLDHGGFNAEFDSLKSTIASDTFQTYPDGADNSDVQRAAVTQAIDKVEALAKDYAGRMVNEHGRRKEAEERARRGAGENCMRSKRACIPFTNKCATVHFPDPACLARNAWNAATKWVSDLWNGIKGLAQTALNAITSVARGAWDGVKTAASWTAARVADAGQWIGEAAVSVGTVLKSLADKLDVAALFRDPLGYLWHLLRDEVLKPAIDFFKRPIEAAKEALHNLVQEAKRAAEGTLRDHVIVPATNWAMSKIFGENAFDKLMDVAKKALGNVESVLREAEAANQALRALAERNLAKFDDALARYRSGVEQLRQFRQGGLVSAVVDYARDRLVAFIRAKAADLLGGALSLVEGPINLGKAGAIAGIASIPAVGGTLAGAADFIITQGLKELRRLAIDFIVNKIVATSTPFLDSLAGFLKGHGGAVEDYLRPVLDGVRPILGNIENRIGAVLEVHDTLTANLAKARERVARMGGGR